MASNKRSSKKSSKTSYPTSKIITSKKTFALTGRQKRLTLLSIIGLLVIGGLGYLGSRFFIDAATANYNIWQWNVAGNKINKGSTTNGMTDAAAKSIVNRNAKLVSFNELCDSQYRDIKARLQKAKWPTVKSGFDAFTSTNPNGCGKNKASGNAIFIKSGIDNVQRTTLQNDGREEVRSMVCGLVRGTKDRFCSTHISTKSDVINGSPINVQQLTLVRSTLEAYYKKGERVIIAGDFNAQPHYGRMNPWYSSSLKVPNNSDNGGVYREVDDNDTAQCLGYGERSTEDGNNEGLCGDKKIDMIFFRENQVASYSGDTLSIAKTCGSKKNALCSDHRILIGNIVFKP